MDEGGAPPGILLVTQYFYPETAAVAQFMTELAVQLRRNGLRVSVLTSRVPYQRKGRLSPSEEYEGIPIRRIWGTGFEKRNSLGRAANLGTFLLNATLRLVVSRNLPPLLFISNAPLLGSVGVVLRFLRTRRYICLIQDVYPDLAIRLGVISERSLLARFWKALNRLVYSRAAALIVLGPHMEAAVRGKFPPGGERDLPIHVIPDWADGDRIRPLPKRRNWFARQQDLLEKVVVLYSGNHGLAHDLETLVEAAERMQGDERFLFLFVGEGGKKRLLMEMTRRKGLNNVRFLPYQPLDHLPFTLTCGDISVVTMERGTEGLVIPSKVYGALAAGQAILGLMEEGSEVADLIREYDCGVRVAPKDVQAVVEVLRSLADDGERLAGMKRRARVCFEKNFRREAAVAKYLEVVRGELPPWFTLSGEPVRRRNS